MPVHKFIVEDIPDFFRKLIDFSGGDEHIWYRGEKSHYYNLLPSAYRNSEFIGNSEVFEQTTIAKARSSMYHILGTSKLEENLNWLCYLQHVGTHTRLLDWTIDISAALYFAFEDYYKKQKVFSEIMPTIWVLNLHSFVNEMRQYIVKEEKPFGIEKDSDKEAGNYKKLLRYFDKYHPKSAYEVLSTQKDCSQQKVFENTYIPFLSPFVHERPKVQGGCFIRFPLLAEKTSSSEFENMWLDKFVQRNEGFNCIAQFIFHYPREIYSELNVFNLEASRIYPEEMNIANEINHRLSPIQ